MKRNLFLLFIGLLSLCASAQANREDVRKLLQVNGTANKYDALINRFSASLTESKRDAFRKDVKEFINRYIESEVKFYANEFSQDEILKLIEFYRSPLGTKYIEKSKEITENNVENAQKTEMELQGIIMKYMM